MFGYGPYDGNDGARSYDDGYDGSYDGNGNGTMMGPDPMMMGNGPDPMIWV